MAGILLVSDCTDAISNTTAGICGALCAPIMRHHNMGAVVVINQEAAGVLLAASKHIARWAKQAEKPEGKETFASRRAASNAWRATVFLIPVLEHAKESDLYYTLLGIAIRDKKSDKEQYRLNSIARDEDRAFMGTKRVLEETIAEAVRVEKADPRGEADKADEIHTAKLTAAGEQRQAEEKVIERELRRAKTSKEKASAQARYEAAWDVFRTVSKDAGAERDSVYRKFGLETPEMKLQKERKVTGADVTRKLAVGTAKAAAKEPAAKKKAAPTAKKKAARA